MASLAIGPVQRGRVSRHPVLSGRLVSGTHGQRVGGGNWAVTHIPYDDGLFGPLDTDVKVGAKGDVIVQELEQGVALLLLVPHDVARD